MRILPAGILPPPEMTGGIHHRADTPPLLKTPGPVIHRRRPRGSRVVGGSARVETNLHPPPALSASRGHRLRRGRVRTGPPGTGADHRPRPPYPRPDRRHRPPARCVLRRPSTGRACPAGHASPARTAGPRHGDSRSLAAGRCPADARGVARRPAGGASSPARLLGSRRRRRPLLGRGATCTSPPGASDAMVAPARGGRPGRRRRRRHGRPGDLGRVTWRPPAP